MGGDGEKDGVGWGEQREDRVGSSPAPQEIALQSGHAGGWVHALVSDRRLGDTTLQRAALAAPAFSCCQRRGHGPCVLPPRQGLVN